MARRFNPKRERLTFAQAKRMGFPERFIDRARCGDPTGDPWQEMPEGQAAIAASLQATN